jgi:hypothetical protein
LFSESASQAKHFSLANHACLFVISVNCLYMCDLYNGYVFNHINLIVSFFLICIHARYIQHMLCNYHVLDMHVRLIFSNLLCDFNFNTRVELHVDHWIYFILTLYVFKYKRVSKSISFQGTLERRKYFI